MDIIELKRTMWITVFIFIVFALYFYVVGYKENIPVYMECMRVAFTVCYCYTICLAVRLQISKTLFFSYLFFSFLLLSIVLLNSRLYSGDKLFGNTKDAYFYMSSAIKWNGLGLNDYWTWLLKYTGANLDDLGFCSIMYFVVKPFGNDTVSIATFLILINSIIYIIGVYYFFKLCIILLKDENKVYIATALWAGFTRLVTTSAGGAKEVIFTALIILAMYHIYEYKERHTTFSLAKALLFICTCLFFRFAICYALILSLLTIVFTNENNKRTIIKLAFFLLLFSGTILSVLLPILTGMSFEHIQWVTGNRMSRVRADSLTMALFPSLSLFLGPFPNMDRTNITGFMYGFSLLLKDFISPYFISAIYGIIRNFSYQFYPLLVFIICNLMMLLVSGVTLDIRYHITYMPFFFLLVMAPYKFIFKGYKYYVILSMIVIVIGIYSTRILSKG